MRNLEPFETVQPIIRNMQLDKLNNKKLHNKVSKTHKQVEVAPTIASLPAANADAAAAARADLLKPNAAAEC